MSVPVPAEPAVPAEAVDAVADQIVRLRGIGAEMDDETRHWTRLLANAAAPAIRASERQHLTRAMNLDSAITQAATDLGIHAPEWRMKIFRELCAAVAVVARDDERELALDAAREVMFEQTDAAIAKATAGERQRLADEIPSLIVKIDGELSPADIEQVKRNFHAALAEHDRCGKEASAAVALILAKTDRIAELESRLRDSHQAIHDLHADRDHDEQRINELAARIAVLEQLARDILTRYLDTIRGSYRPDDVREEIEQWEATLKGQQ